MIRNRRRGQSTVEFALMMPFILGITFFILEFQIFAVGMHHTAYASYAAARGYIVSHQGDGGPIDSEAKLQREFLYGGSSPILTGRIYQENAGGPPQLALHRRGYGGDDSMWQITDGVTVSMPSFGSLPYARALLQINTEVPTHLGPDEWDPSIRSHDGDSERRYGNGTNRRFTDNNRDDF